MKKILTSAAFFVTFLYFVGTAFAADNSKDKWLIYWYVSGSNLERDYGFMTADMQEMINVPFLTTQEEDWIAKSEENSAQGDDDLFKEEKPVVQTHSTFPLGSQLSPNVKVLIQTDGCGGWYNDDIPNNTIGRYLCDNLGVHYQGAFEDTSMGENSTLENFLRYGKDKIEKDFKPNHRIFIFSGHGGLAQVCYDERYEDAALDLNAVHKAFAKVFKTSPNNPPFEFIGFDACVRATYENANSIYGLARYMIASEETEAGEGWYYTDWIHALSENPAISTKRLGKMICQDSFNFLVEKQIADAEIATFSMIDLSPEKWLALRKAYDNFGKVTLNLTQKDLYFYRPLAMAMNNTKRYSYSENYRKGLTADLKDFAKQTQKYLPEDLNAADRAKILNATNDLAQAVNGAVVFNIYGEQAEGSNGIATYYPLESKFLEEDFEVYSKQKFIPKYLKDVYGRLIYGNDPAALFEGNENENAPATRSTPQKKSKKNSTRSLRSVFNIESLNGMEVQVDEDTDEVFVNLTPEQLKSVASVSCVIAAVLEDGKSTLGIETDGIFIFGESAAIQSDWANGKFTDKFGAKWPMLNQHPVLMLLAEMTNDTVDENGNVTKSGYATYNIPIGLNGELCTLRAAYRNDIQTFQILGAVKNVETKGRSGRAASRGLTPLKKGDEITPVLFAIVDAEDVGENTVKIAEIRAGEETAAMIFFRGESFKIEDQAILQNETLADGDYYYQFGFSDPLGNKAYSKTAYFDVFEGEVLYSEQSTPDEDEPELEVKMNEDLIQNQE